MHQNTARQSNMAQNDKLGTSTRGHTLPSTEYRDRFISPHRHMPMTLTTAQRILNPPTTGTTVEMANLRKHFCCVRAQSRPSTEYRDRYIPPEGHPAIILSAAQKSQNPSLKGTTAELALRSICGNKCTKHIPKATPLSESTKYHRRCSSITHLPVHLEAEHIASTAEDYTSVYKNDFQSYKVKKRLPYKQANSLTVNQGLVVTGPPKSRKAQPFESLTSYRCDYVAHPVKPVHKVKPDNSTKGLLTEPATSSSPRAVWEVNQEICDKATAFFQDFKTWSLENNFCGQGKDRETCQLADDFGVYCRTRPDAAEHICCCVTPDMLPIHTCRAFA